MQYKTDQYENGLTGQEIKEIRTKAGLTQEEFGARLNLSKRQVWSLEHNDKNTTAISDLIRATNFTRPRKQYGISGEQVAKLRKKKGLSQAEFGRRMGLTKRQVWSMEHRDSNTGERRERIKSMKAPHPEVTLTGQHLKMIRDLTDLSQTKFAKELGLSQSTYNYMEHKERNLPVITEKIREAFPEEFEQVINRLELVPSETDKAPQVGLSGAQVKAIRLFAGMTQSEFSEKLGLRQPVLSKLEVHGRTTIPLEQKLAELFPTEYYMVTARKDAVKLEPLTGTQILQIRKNLKMSQSRFAQRIGVSQPGVNNSEHREIASLAITARIQAAFPEEYEAAINKAGAL